jgi:tRNA pseudouridine38-40 synthase
MRNIKLTISYDGTLYKGWQSQKNGNTLQQEIEKAISKIFGKHHTLYGASRTDSGVHAKGQTANFKVSTPFPASKISEALNAVLPPDILIKRSEEVPLDLHSRFDAKSKLYRYNIVNSRTKDPFSDRYVWRVPYPLDAGLMDREAGFLVGTHDFKCFQASDKRERSSVRKITMARVRKTGRQLRIDIEGDGFLYNMVRNIAGTLVDIGRGYLPPGSMTKILRSKDRKKAGPTAPARGLFLLKIRY